MDTSNWNMKYVSGNVVIAVVVILWAGVLLNLANTPLQSLHMILVSVIQGVFWAAGWRYFIIKPQQLEEKKEVCTELVSAVIVDYRPESRFGDLSSTDESVNTKVAVYSFVWDGYEMTATSDLLYKGVVRRNFQTEIFVNPYNPNEIYEHKIERSRLAHYRFCGTMLMIAGFGSFFYTL